MAMPEPLHIAVTTASFLPATALSTSAIHHAASFASREGFAGIEILMTRAGCALAHRSAAASFPVRVVSVHEVWNPRVTLRSEIGHILTRTPQSRGMVPYPMDCLFFGNSDASEEAAFSLADQHNAVSVVSQLASPVNGQRYPGRRACVQVHPDLGPCGTHIPLEHIAGTICEQDYGVVLDTYHVRRAVRRFIHGKTEINPPAAGPGDVSLGGIRRVWDSLGDRVRLVHFQPGVASELAHMLETATLPPALRDFVEIAPELARRGIPVVIETSPVVVAEICRGGWRRFATGKGLPGGAMKETMLRVRDVLAALV
jgi:hypothetical protein